MDKQKNFHEFIEELGHKNPLPGKQYFYPDHPFIIGYSFPEDEIEWAVGKLNKAFNQTDNFQNPKWAWLSGPFDNSQTSLLERFVGQLWEEDTSNIDNLADFVIVASESITKRKFLRLLKRRLRRCCNIQNPDLLTWEEIFATINEYMTEQNTAGTNTEQKSTEASGKADLPNEKPEGRGQNINIQNFTGVLGNVQQPENLQIGDHACIPNHDRTEEKKKGIIRKLLKIIVRIIGAIVIGIIVAVVIDILGDFGWLQSIKVFILPNR